ncbi:MAG: HAMP domain-containing sensor histidine kinase [Solirubrobacterales bacterium]
MRRAIVIALAAFLAGAAAVAVPNHMGADQILLVVIAAGAAALATAVAVRLAMEERMRSQVEEARRQLVAAASHDLRTPLASLRLLVESIDDGVATGETRDRYLREIRTHVAVLSDLIDDLFELSRIEAGDISWTIRQVELGDLIDETVAAMRAPAEQKGVVLTAELPPGGVVAEADAEKVQRVLFNLIQNAIRHTPPDGTVTIRAHPAHGAVEVEVADDGEGIAAGDREQVFDAFYRGDESRGEDGAGLGLAISRAIVEAHGGRIWLDDGQPGTRVRFTLAAG